MFAAVPAPSRKLIKIVAAAGIAVFVILPVALIHSAARGTRLLESAVIGAPTPAHGDLRVTFRPVEAEVYVDGSLRGMTPLLVELPAGNHSIRVGSPRMEHWRAADVTIRDNVEHRLDVDLSE
jgi:hypothetical protein